MKESDFEPISDGSDNQWYEPINDAVEPILNKDIISTLGSVHTSEKSEKVYGIILTIQHMDEQIINIKDQIESNIEEYNRIKENQMESEFLLQQLEQSAFDTPI